MTRATAHVDTYVLDRLPPPDLCPRIDLSGVPGLDYPERLNAAAELLDHWVTMGHEGIALRHAAGDWTYQRLFEAANRIARVLVEDCALVPGGRVLLRGANSPMLVACWFAVLKAGGIAVTTMPLLRERELSDIIEQAGIVFGLSESSVAPDLEAALSRVRGACVVRYGLESDTAGLEARMAGKAPTFENVPTGAEDPAIVAFTSGTTGRGKGTVHTHRDLLAVCDTYGRHVLAPQADDIFIGTPPIAFTYALGGLVLFPMRVGASTALVEQMSPPVLLASIQKFRATVAFTSPTAYRAMVGQAASFDLTSLRKCISAGETLPAATFEAWRDATGVRLMDGIGSTEMLHIFVGCRADEAKAGATGKAVPGYRAKVVDDQGREVPRGTVGRLAVQGPTGCRYLADGANQRKYVEQGWNLTGDAYRQDEDGYFRYEARTDDLIISSGYNISGVEVENALLAHPAVSECAVVGVPDDARGQLVKAFIVPASGREGSEALARELQDFVKQQIAPYKYPRAVEFVGALPRTLTGKLQRFRLRAAALAPSAEIGSAGLTLHEPGGWPRPAGYSTAVSATGRTIFVSGQVGWDPLTSTFSGGGFAAEVRQALTNVVSALASAGARPDQIARMTWYITDRDEYLSARKAIGEAWRQVIGRHYPAMSVVIVAGLLEPEARVEIEATAVVYS